MKYLIYPFRVVVMFLLWVLMHLGQRQWATPAFDWVEEHTWAPTQRTFFLLLAPFSARIRCKYYLHDYKDCDCAWPAHFKHHTCFRCGTSFTI
ncbi:MAG TPA: hypothetical protein VEH04_16900 [Verrucomicrobiae bacterium]|nr:hypothetical protein [Verrucomicrobiae bacterium]